MRLTAALLFGLALLFAAAGHLVVAAFVALACAGVLLATPQEPEPGSRADAWNRNHARPAGGRR